MSNPMLRDFGAKHPDQQAPGAQHGYPAPQQGQYGYGQPQTPSPQQMQGWYQAPSATGADTGRMTYGDVMNRTTLVLGAVIVFAVIGWQVPGLALIGGLVGLVLGLVNAFKREPSPVLIMLYAAAQGLFLGGFSMIMEYTAYSGIVLQAVIGTVGVAAVVLVLYRMRILRTTPALTKIVLVAMLGYFVFGLVNLGLSLFAGFNMRSDISIFGIPLGVIVGGIAILLAAYSLVMDFENIENGVGRVARKYAWSAAFGLAVTLIWLYVEILRVLAIFSSDD